MVVHTSHIDRVTSCGIKGSLQLMQDAYLKKWNLMEFSFINQMKQRGFYEITEGKNGYLFI